MQESIRFFMIGAGCMLFMLMAIYFARIKEKTPFDRILSYVLLFWTVLFWKDILFLIPGIHNSEYAEMLLMSIDMWAVAVCAFYLVGLLSPHSLTIKFILLNLLPFMLFTFTYAIWERNIIFISNIIFALLYSIIVFFYFVRKISIYNKMLKDNYSDLEYLNVAWLKKALGLLVCCLLVWVYDCFYPSSFIDSIYYCTAIMLWAVICYYSNQQETVSDLYENDSIQSEMLLPKSNYAFVEQLHELSANGYLYQNPKLTMNELANTLGTNRTYLSDYLNNELHTNFYDFVNSCRLRQAVLFLSDSDCRLTLDEIAENSGFNSVSTFRRAFLKKHNCSPIQYKNKINPGNK